VKPPVSFAFSWEGEILQLKEGGGLKSRNFASGPVVSKEKDQSTSGAQTRDPQSVIETQRKRAETSQGYE